MTSLYRAWLIRVGEHREYESAAPGNFPPFVDSAQGNLGSLEAAIEQFVLIEGSLSTSR